MANVKITKEWFKLAIRDLKSSKALVDCGPEHKYAAAYFAQQCAEKSIKGYLTFCNIRIAKTHDLEVLAKLLMPLDPVTAEFILKHKSLSELAVIYRYPDSEKKTLTMRKTVQAKDKAKLIYDTCYKACFLKA